MSVLNSGARPALVATAPRRARDDRHSRRVALLKRFLPVVGVALLALITIWPRLVPLLDSVRFGLAAIDLHEAHELRMLNPRYAGVDRYDRPYVVTSAVGRQASNRDDLMSLERPRAEMTMHNGARVVVTAATAMYQSQAQLLDLFGDVNLIHENGTRFVTNTAHVDVAANSAMGDDPVTGHGPSGDITAQGFRVIDKGDTIVFTGTSHLVLKGAKPSSHPAASPSILPPEVAETAAIIEPAAMTPQITASGLPIPADPQTGLMPITRASRPVPLGDPPSVAQPDAKAPLVKAPSAVKAKGDAG